MANRFKAAARKASDMTNKQLGTEIAAITSHLTRDTLQKLLPRKTEKEAFLELMQQVEQEKEMDERIAYLRENIQSAGKVVFKLLGLLV